MAKKWIAKGNYTEGDVRVKKEEEKKVYKNYATKPQMNPKEAERPPLRMQSFSEFASDVQNFARYEADKKRQQEQETRDAAIELLRGGRGQPAEDQRAAARTYAEELDKNRGYKRVGNQVVYATPYSPLPKPGKEYKLPDGKTFTNEGTKAKAPGAFNIAPSEYLDAMKSIDELGELKKQGAPKRASVSDVQEKGAVDFLNKWFPEKVQSGEMPTMDEVLSKYGTIDEFNRDGYWMEWQSVSPALEGYMARGNKQEQAAYQKELDEAQAARDEAIRLLGKGAEEFAGGSTADYLGRYGQTYRAGDVAREYEKEYQTPGMFGTFDEHDAAMQSIAARGKENSYSGTSLETGATLLQSRMTDEQANTYMLLAKVYGEDAAQEYYKSLLSDEGYNEEAYFIRDKALRDEANKNWAGATAKTFLNVPGQIAGGVYGLGRVLKGEEIDPFDSAFIPAQAVQTPRDEVGKMITRSVGTKDEKGNARDNILSWLVKSGYQALTSTGDSAIAGLLGAGAPGVGAALQGAWGMGGSMQDVTMRGGSGIQAGLAGLIDAGVETLTEYLPMEHLIKTLDSKDIKSVKNILTNAIKGGLIEAPAEGLSELAGYISDDLIMGEMSNWNTLVNDLGVLGAAKQVAGDVLNGAFVGFLSGGGSNAVAGTVSSYKNRKTNKQDAETANAEMPQAQAENRIEEKIPQEQAQTTGEPYKAQREVTGKKLEELAETPEEKQDAEQVTEQPVQQPEKKTKEQPADKNANQNQTPFRVEREVTGEKRPESAQDSRSEPEKAKLEEGKAAKDTPVKTAENAKEGKPFKVERQVAVRRNGVEQNMTVTGVEDASEGNVFFRATNDDGDVEIISASDTEFVDPVQQELMSYAGVARMNALGVRNYLDGYDASLATPQEYAQAYESAYMDGAAGLDYERMLKADRKVTQHLTEKMRLIAYAAGEQQAMVKSRGARYQKILLNTLNKAAGGKIRLVDEDIGGNGYYDRKTGEIVISSRADKGAYAYVAVHELGHKLKAESKTAWDTFSDLVIDALLANGTDIDERIAQVKDLYKKRGQELTTDEALEEVICNSAAAILQDEKIVRDMVAKDRTLMERVVDFLREFIDRMAEAIRRSGEELSGLGSWKQLDALKNDHESLEKIYKSLMSALESTQETVQQDVSDANVVKMSTKEADSSFETAQKKYAGKDLANDKSLYDYDFLVALPDMQVTTMERAVELQQDGKPSEKKVIQAALKNGSLFGKSDENGVSVQNLYTGRNIRLTVKGIRHGLGRGTSGAALANARATAKAGELLRNALPINALYDTGKAATGTYAMAAYMKDAQGNQDHIAVLTIEQRSGDVVGMEVYDTLHALNTRKRNAVDPKVQTASAAEMQGLTSTTRSVNVSISNFLEIVNETHQSLLSEDVLSHFNEERNPQGYYSGRAKFSLREDGAGTELTKEQQTYFADSEVRDENGKLMVMYHGTPNGSYDRFRSGTYFTPMKDYADDQNQHASSISVKKNADNPQTYQVYLNMKKPFDTRNAKERSIFMNEYYRKYGTGTPLMESGLPDWTDGMDLQEFIEEMGYDYDGLILDEGGVPDDNGGVKSRGLSYVIFDPSQAKLTENKAPTEDERFRYSMREDSEAVQEELRQTSAAFENVRHTHRITALEADKLAGIILKEAQSEYDRTELAAELAQIFDYVERAEDVNIEYVDDMQTRLMYDVMQKSRVLDEEHEMAVDPIRKYLKGTRIRLSEGQQKEAANMMGSYGAYVRKLFGRVKLSKGAGTDLDVAWEEIREMLPGWIPEANEGDMPRILMDLVDFIKPVYNTSMRTEEMASWLAGKLNEAYLNLPAVRESAKSRKELNLSIRDLRKAMARFEEENTEEFGAALEMLEESRRRKKDESDKEAWAEVRRQWDEWKERDKEEKEKRFQLELKHAKDKLKTRDLAMRRVYAQVMMQAYNRQRMKDSAERREREMVSKQRGRTEATVRTMLNWLDNPTDAKHVPSGLEEPLRDVLTSLDFSGKNTKAATELANRLDRLATAVESAQEGEDENRTMFLERDQQMIDELRRVATLIRGNTEGRGVYDLNGLELQQLNKWLGVVKHVLTGASKMRGSGFDQDVSEVAAESILEISRKKPMKDKKWITKQYENLFGVDMLDSFTFFERLGRTGTRVFNELRKGFDKMAQHVKTAEDYTQKAIEGLDLKGITGKKAKKETFRLENGRILEMTRAQIMELYVLNKREQARGHIYGDGFVVRGDEETHANTITEPEVEKIISTLTEKEKEAADKMQRFLAEECGRWGNETSLKLLGYKKFGEEHYWPISTDPNVRNTTKLDDVFAANINAIKNQGMTKQLVEGAKNAIVIGDIFDTYTRHISNMAAYSAYAVPLSDFTRWYNSRGVKVEIANVMGAKADRYIKNFLMAINGTAQKADPSAVTKAASVFTRNAKTASVGANVRVAIQQPTSYARAAMYISPKFLTAAIGKNPESEELVNKYCSIAAWKRYGFRETNIGPNLRQIIIGDKTGIEMVREASMALAEAGDNWTLNTLWVACELETDKLMPELKKGTQEYYEHVGKRMSEIVDRTQVVDSPFHRSAMMRSKNAMDQMLTNFMSEPTKTYNMLMSAIYDYAENRKNPAAAARLAKALGVWGASAVLTAAAAGVVDAFRDDDDEKDWIEKYLSALEGNALESLNPLGMLPYVKDVLSVFEGYEPNRLDQQSIQRIVWAADEIKKFVNGESRQNWYGVAYKVAQAFSSAVGVPVSNVMRDFNALYTNVAGISPTLNTEAQKGSYVNQLFAAIQKGDAKKQATLRVKLGKDAGLTAKEIDLAIAVKLSEDERIAEAWRAKKSGRIGDVNRTKNALAKEGFTGEMVDKAIVDYGNRAEPKPKKEKDPNEQLSAKLYSYDDAMVAINAGASVDDIKTMMSEMAADSTAKNPEKAVRDELKSRIKKEYQTAWQKKDSEKMHSLEAILRDAIEIGDDEIQKWIKGWSKTK